MTTPAVDFDLGSSGSQPGDKLGVWRLHNPLAEVPSGRWWLAQHSLSNQGAWVLVYARAEDAGAVLLRIAQTEGQPWQHPDIAWPLDSGLTADGRPYVVMPLVDGEPLLAGAKQASLRRRLEWVVQLCELLLMAEGAGFALVELDPSLLWVGPQNQLRLMALALVRADASVLRMGALQGQLSHAAQPLNCPAQAAGTPGSGSAQVFTVGMLMCLLVNGRLPQVGEANAAPVQALSQWLALRPEARESLDQMLRRASAINPKDRPGDLGDLAAAIEGWLDASGGMASTEAGALDSALRQKVAEAPTVRMPLQEAAAPRPVAAPPAPASVARAAPATPAPASRKPAPEDSAAWLWLVGAAVLIAGVALALWLR